MPTTTPRPTGLGPTIRQVMIATLWVALLLAGYRVMWQWSILGQSPQIHCLVVPVLLACYPLPWLALLLRLLDRPGPVRTWWVSACLATAGLVAGVSFLLQDVVCFFLVGQTTATFPLSPLLGAVCLWSGVRQWRPLKLGRCDRCGRQSVIPPPRRFVASSGQGWCARCGARQLGDGAAAAGARDQPHERPA